MLSSFRIALRLTLPLIILAVAGAAWATYHSFMNTVQTVQFDLPGLQIASVEDSTRSTGATLFFFPGGAFAAYDARGGAAATAETTLLDDGSYSNQIDGIVFAGGSTMGLAAGDGVREAVFKSRSGRASAFDAIPSIPTAVVYDFGSRKGPGQNPLAYPDRTLGLELMKRLSNNSFNAGRAGAGLSTTANKRTQKVWGGQGLAVRDLGYAKVVAAVVVNAMGDLNIAGLKPIPNANSGGGVAPGQNTTLSIVITDAKLSRSQLKRLAVMVHTSMARSIFPFHSFYDGDTNFAVSTAKRGLPADNDKTDHFMDLSIAASEAMKEAIELGARAANNQN